MTLTTNQKKRRTLCLIAVLGLNAWAQDGGVITISTADAPKVTILPGDSYLFNKAAFDVTNAEMKRLQGIERLHKSEQWATPVLIGMAVGFVAGAAVAVPLTYVTLKK